jgi:hypothetical protein
MPTWRVPGNAPAGTGSKLSRWDEDPHLNHPMLYWFKSIRHVMNIGIAADGFASRRRDTDDRNAAIDRLAVKLLGGARNVIERTALASYRCLDGRAEGLNFRVAPRFTNERGDWSACSVPKRLVLRRNCASWYALDSTTGTSASNCRWAALVLRRAPAMYPDHAASRHVMRQAAFLTFREPS